MSFTILIFPAVAGIIFFVKPRLKKFRATIGIDTALKSKALSFAQKLRLRALGLKTPVLSSLAFFWTFLIAEGDELRGFAWDQLMSHEHAVWIASGLWAVQIWSHFSGLQAAAASPPVITPLPSAIPVALKA